MRHAVAAASGITQNLTFVYRLTRFDDDLREVLVVGDLTRTHQVEPRAPETRGTEPEGLRDPALEDRANSRANWNVEIDRVIRLPAMRGLLGIMRTAGFVRPAVEAAYDTQRVPGTLRASSAGRIATEDWAREGQYGVGRDRETHCVWPGIGELYGLARGIGEHTGPVRGVEIARVDR